MVAGGLYADDSATLLQTILPGSALIAAEA